MPRCAKSFHNTLLMVPSGGIANDPPFAVLAWARTVLAQTAPSTMAVDAGEPVVPGPTPASVVSDVWTPPAQPPPPFTWMRRFHLASLGSQTSMPMPANVEGASDG